MKKQILILIIFGSLFSSLLLGQTNNFEIPTSIREDGAAPDPSAILDLNANDKGILIPRMSLIERLSLTPSIGLLVYQTNGLEGFYFYADNGSGANSWKKLSDGTVGTDNDWTVSGNNLYNANSGKVGIGKVPVTGDAKLDIKSNVGEDGLRVRINNSTKLKVLANSGTVIGGNQSAPPDGLHVVGNTGLGFSTAEERLVINGALRLDGVASSNNPIEGTIRYNESVDDFEGYDGTNWKSLTGQPNTNQTTYAVGDYAQGGVVYWVNPSGTHGKVMHIFELNSPLHGIEMPWSNITNTASNAQSESDGLSNSLLIVNQAGHTESAAQLCLDLVANGYDDWYLPARSEFRDLMNPNGDTVRQTIIDYGGDDFDNSGHFQWWTSTETNSSQSFDLGYSYITNSVTASTQGVTKSNNSLKVRAIRSF